MQTGLVEANLVNLNEKFNLKYLPELIEQKITGAEKRQIADANLNFYRQEYERLVSVLEAEHQRSNLAETGTAKNELNDLLIRLRLKQR